MDIVCLVINVKENIDRRVSIIRRLSILGLDHHVVNAKTPNDIENTGIGNMVPTAVAVWYSHLDCIKIAANSGSYTLILEDDAQLMFDKKELDSILGDMHRLNIDFIQIGFLKLHIFDAIGIEVRNIYASLLKIRLLSSLFDFLGLKESSRFQLQTWRKSIPPRYILNDIRYGAHCYIVSPAFASRVSLLNDPQFLAIDDFFVALSRMKSFKMVRLRKSRSGQDGSTSSFQIRYGTEI